MRNLRHERIEPAGVARPPIFSAAICNRIACNEIFSVVTAILSPGPRSSIFSLLGRAPQIKRQCRIAPMLRTAQGVPLILPQSGMKTVAPPLTMSSSADSSPSFIGLPAGNWRQVTLVDCNPPARDAFQSVAFCWIEHHCKRPRPYWVAICSLVILGARGSGG